MTNLLTLDEILANATPAPQRMIGIYFLLKAGEVVYVGQTVHATSRVHDHLRDKDFDSWAFLPLAKEFHNEAEWAYISAFRPKLNTDPRSKTLMGISMKRKPRR